MAPRPVVCIAEIPVAVLNKLLEDALAGSEDLAPGSDHELVIIEALEDGTSKPPADDASVPPLDGAFRPFVAASVGEAAKHVGDAAYFAVLDKDSAANSTVLLVSADGSGEQARVTFDQTQAVMTSLGMGSLGFGEIQSIADSNGGVYGSPSSKPQRGGPAPRMRLGGD